MNEQIKELHRQVMRWADTKDCPIGVEFTVPEEYTKKFAELIVQECLEIVEKQFGGGNGDGVEWDRAIEFTYEDLKQHFGVE